MHLTTEQVLALSEVGLRQFISLAIPEGLYLDYKEALSGGSDKDAKREFLKDVTAFANAAGGQLILGVKEPAEGLPLDQQIVGLVDAEALAQDLERLCSTSIDPRIPGLRIIRIPSTSSQSCLVIHIPPSLGRPHMVSHGAHRSFYVRHSESSFPMTTHEIREAVLASASSEGRARRFLEQRLEEARTSLHAQSPAFFLQAMPLIAPEAPWNVLSSPFEEVLRGRARIDKFAGYATLASHIQPKPTIDGLQGLDARDDSLWETEIHRTGYVSAFYRDIQTTEVYAGEQRYVVHSGTADIFRAFCHMLDELVATSGSDVPYLITGTYLRAHGSYLWTESKTTKFHGPYMKAEINWPEHLRQTGTDSTSIGESMCVELFNAFGLKGVAR
jgi:hypothetical protein